MRDVKNVKSQSNDFDNRPQDASLVGYAAEFGIDFDSVYEIIAPTKEERSEMRRSGWSDTRRKADFHLPEGARYVAYAGQIADKGGVSAEGALTMGFIRVMDIETKQIASNMGIAYFQRHSKVVGRVADLEVSSVGV